MSQIELEPSAKEIQSQFFNRLKSLLDPNQSLVDCIADMLDVSGDSAYRRIRGEKLLNIGELKILAGTFKISIDELLLGITNGMFFNYKSVRRSDLNFNIYFDELAETMERIKAAPNPHMLYAAWDVPVFHYFNFPEIMLFKTYFWRKCVWNDPKLEYSDFRLKSLMDHHGQTLKDAGERILNAYVNLPSVEIWHDWTIESTLKQLEFGIDSGFFVNPSDGQLILEQIYQLMEHIKDQTQSGYKFKYGQKPEEKIQNFELYLNEIFFLNNTIVAQADNIHEVYVIHESVNYLTTTNPQFCQETAEWLEVQKRKSFLLTNSSELIRNKFFAGQYRKIEKMMAKL